MDVEKLIRRLRNDADAYRNGKTLGRAFADQEDVLDNAATALSTLQTENKKLRAELEQVKRENDALWIYIEIVDREYQRYMDRSYIDRLDELKRTWRRGQKED